jgi:hypothetical protein
LLAGLMLSEAVGPEPLVTDWVVQLPKPS